MRLSVLFDLCLFSHTSHPPPTIPSSQFQNPELPRPLWPQKTLSSPSHHLQTVNKGKLRTHFIKLVIKLGLYRSSCVAQHDIWTIARSP